MIGLLTGSATYSLPEVAGTTPMTLKCREICLLCWTSFCYLVPCVEIFSKTYECVLELVLRFGAVLWSLYLCYVDDMC